MATPTSPGVVVSYGLSGQNRIDSLLWGTKWGTGGAGSGVGLTYSFGTAASFYSSTYYAGEPGTGFGALTAAQKAATYSALALWAEVADITFTEVTDSASVAGDLRYARSDAPAPTAWAYLPGPYTEAGDVWIGPNSGYVNPTPGSYGFAVFLHETGHAIGLTHPHTPSGIGTVADIETDTTAYSVMSYRSYAGAPLNGYTQSFFPTTPMLHDIAAIQYVYGANTETRSGDTVYSWAPGQQILETIWDGGGTDTIDWSNQTGGAVIDLNEGAWSRLGPAYWTGVAYESDTLAIAYDVEIENAVGGSGNDRIIGNALDNVLRGGSGNDTLEGHAGNDWLIGGGGSDTLDGGDGTSGNDTLEGNRGFDTLYGGLGEDELYGGVGNDWLYGGFDDDTLYGGDDNDSLFGAEGADALHGDEGVDSLFGSLGNDRMYGGAGNDLLRGGVGDDTLDGGSGRDTAEFVGNRDDYTIELSGEALIVTDLSPSFNDEGIDRLKGFEVLKFRDNSLNVADLDLNDAPTDIALGDNSVAENAPGAVVGTVIVDDPNAGDTHSFAVDDARFEVADGRLKLKAGQSLDHEAAAEIPVAVTATDSGGLSLAKSFTLVVRDVNEAPTALALSNAPIDEGVAGATVGALTVGDPDRGDSHSFAVDDARFEVVGGQLKLKAGESLDAADDGLQVSVTATDSGGLSLGEAFTLTVVPAGRDLTLIDAGFDGGTGGFVYLDDPFGTAAGAYADGGHRPGAGFSGGALGVSLGGIDGADVVGMSGGWQQSFDLAAAASVTLAFRYNLTQASNYESDEVSQLRVWLDGAPLSGNAVLAEVVGNGNGGPARSTGWQTVELDLGVLGPGSHSLTIGGYNNKKTLADETTDLLIDDVTVTALGSEPVGNRAPTDIALSNGAVAEDATGAIVGDLTVDDPDVGDSHSFAVDDARFEVVDGQLKLKAGESLTADDDGLQVSVTTTDSGGLSLGEAFTLTVVPAGRDLTLIDAGFDGGTGGFVYLDDPFGTAAGAYADGGHRPGAGFSGGALGVSLGGIDGADVVGMSGGWQQSFDLAAAASVTLAFRYNLTQASNYESDEVSQLRVWLDGAPLSGNAVLAEVVGNGNGGPARSTGWQTVELDLGVLGPGSHSLTIGGYNNKKTLADETTDLLIDDVLLTAGAAGSSALSLADLLDPHDDRDLLGPHHDGKPGHDDHDHDDHDHDHDHDHDEDGELHVHPVPDLLVDLAVPPPPFDPASPPIEA